MLSFKDYLAVHSTGETELQDLNAKKRHRALGMWEDAAAQKECGDPVDPNTGTKRMIVGETDHQKKLADREDRLKAQEIVKAHHKKLGPDPLSYGQLKKAGKL